MVYQETKIGKIINKDSSVTMEDICLDNWLVSRNSDTDKNKIKFRKNESLIGFGCGSRDCVGQQLAIKEFNLILAHSIVNYHINPQKGDLNFKLKRYFGSITAIEYLKDDKINGKICEMYHFNFSFPFNQK